MLPPSVANEGTEAGFLEPSVPPEVLRAVLPVLRPSPRPCRHGRPVSPAGRPCFIPALAPALALQPPAGLSPSPGAQEGRHEGGRLPQGRGCGGGLGASGDPWAGECSAWGGGCEEVPQSQGCEQSLEPSVQGLPPPRCPPAVEQAPPCGPAHKPHTEAQAAVHVRCPPVLQAASRASPGQAAGRLGETAQRGPNTPGTKTGRGTFLEVPVCGSLRAA